MYFNVILYRNWFVCWLLQAAEASVAISDKIKKIRKEKMVSGLELEIIN